MNKMFLMAVISAGLIFADDVNAQGRRKVIRGREGYWAHTITPVVELPPNKPTVNDPKAVENKSQSAFETCEDALDEVNAKRASMGLKPFIKDKLLTQAALACAKQRAARLIAGHLPESDFSYLPSGGQAVSAGCGAMEDSWGWNTCCYDGNYTYAGAAWVRGSNGERFMHIFVR